MDEQSILYEIWLAQTCKHEPDKIARTIENLGNPKEVFSSDFYDERFRKSVGLSNVLTVKHNLDDAKRFLDNCRKNNINIISIEDDEYPERLRHINLPPRLLYSIGKLPDLNKLLCITVVGTRNCSKDGRKIAEDISEKLAESGVGIVSGMALGIDGAAHSGAMKAGGTTIAVLAGGVDLVYPPEHNKLYKFIQNYGAVISERPPGVRGRGYFYQQRNRIMVGLSQGVLIVEGKKSSGTAITARLATESNRDVYAIPGKPTELVAGLPNELIRDGVKLVTDPLDILEEYVGIYPEMLEYGMSIKGKPLVGKPLDKKGTVKETNVSYEDELLVNDSEFEKFLEKEIFNDNERRILRYLYTSKEKVYFDDIVDNCGIDAGTLGSMIIILQMKKAVKQDAGGQFALNIE